MSLHLLSINALLTLVYMSGWFVVARLRNRLDTVDIAWGLGFVVLAWSTVLQLPTNRSLLIAVLVTVWGVRLSNHIWQRARRRGEDPRYEELAARWKGNRWRRAYFSIFVLQGALVLIIGLPIMFAASPTTSHWRSLAIAGTAIWLIGFIIESLADAQLAQYLKLSSRPKVLETGLWHYSRHPNYFGELVQWWGIGIIALATSWGWIGLVGPLTLTILIILISGIPPIERRRAKDPAYRAYQARTSPLIPLPARRA